MKPVRVVPQAVRTAVRSVAGRTCHAWPRISSKFTGKALVLMYHRVLPRSEAAASFVQPGLYVTPATFERQLRFLQSQFEILPLAELFTRWRSGDWDARARYCSITFDDGWLDNYQYAFPLLRGHGVPATIFLSTDLIGTNEWLWSDKLAYLLGRGRAVPGFPSFGDPDAVIERAKTMPDGARDSWIGRLAGEWGIELPSDRRFLGWNEVREMSRDGIAFGSHTATHAILTRLGDDALARELRRPLEVIAQQSDAWVPVLAYPNGDHSDAVAAAAEAAGYLGAFTTVPGIESSKPADFYRLKRVGFHEDVSGTNPLLTSHLARQVRLS
jgi:peptidoglycan/xylan/chitin deacetylase (PgdA/CDA1 family)